MVKLIAIDGADGSGKTIISQHLQEHLKSKGKKALIIEYPRNTFFGNIASKLLVAGRNRSDSETAVIPLLLAFSYAVDFLFSTVSYRFKKGADTIIFVRYTLTLAYLPERIGTILFIFFTKLLPAPDIGIYVKVSEEIALSRFDQVHEKELPQITENPILLQSVNKKMEKLSKLSSHPKWQELNNDGDLETLFQQVEEIYDNSHL